MDEREDRPGGSDSLPEQGTPDEFRSRVATIEENPQSRMNEAERSDTGPPTNESGGDGKGNAGGDGRGDGEGGGGGLRAALESPITRRRFLAMTGVTMAGLTLGGIGLASCTADEEEGETTTSTSETGQGETTTTAEHGQGGQPPGGGAAARPVVPLMTLTEAQARILEAFVSRLVPADDLGPSAGEAGVVAYIDHALSSELVNERESYVVNLEALDAHAEQTEGGGFVGLSAERQDAIITAMAADEIAGFVPGSAAFFGMVREHTLQGMFGDPFYGGNQDFAGWQLVGFPGIRLHVPEEAQQLDADVDIEPMSVYDFGDFGLRREEG